MHIVLNLFHFPNCMQMANDVSRVRNFPCNFKFSFSLTNTYQYGVNKLQLSPNFEEDFQTIIIRLAQFQYPFCNPFQNLLHL